MQFKLITILMIVAVIFFYFTGAKIIDENNLSLTSFDGITHATQLYFSWLIHIFDNVKDISGNVVKMDWEGNNTIS